VADAAAIDRDKVIAALKRASAIVESGGDLGAAGQICRTILNHLPDHVGALLVLSTVASKRGRFGNALAIIERAIKIAPQNSIIYNNKGLIFHAMRRYEEAQHCFDRALAIDPQNHAAYLNRGNVHLERKRIEEALVDIERSLAIQITPEAFVQQGVAYQKLERYDDALVAFDRALAIRETLGGVNNKGSTLLRLGRFEESLKCFNRAIDMSPSAAQPHYNKGLLELLLGHWDVGFKEWEWRTRIGKRAPPQFDVPQWTGVESLEGKTIFLYSELFPGDTLHFCRYARIVEELGARVIFAAQKPLHTLLRTLSSTIILIPADERPKEPFDFHSPLLSLPLACGTTLDNVPANVPYLAADDARVARWRQTIGSEGFKVGICWQGSTKPYALQLNRSFPLAKLQPLSRLSGVRLISLQKHDGLDQLASMQDGMRVETLGDDFDEGPSAFLDTAAAMHSLDLIVTPDTSVAHLAGALARPVWVALNSQPDWRWLLDRSDSPWYPTARLFRQTERGKWDSVFAGMAEALKALLAKH